MTAIAVLKTYSAGTTLTCWPAGSTSNSVAMTEVATGLYTATLDDTYGTIWFAFVGTSAPTTWDDRSSSGPVIEFDLNQANLYIAAQGGVTVTVTQPVSTDGDIIEAIVIGDDYLAANQRAFTWTIPAVTGFTAGSSTCKFGGKRRGSSWLVTGTVIDLGTGSWKLSFDMAKTVTQSLPPGEYEWSVEIAYGGTEITRVRSGLMVQLISKQT